MKRPEGVTELRVHGVSGTPPEDMLEVPVVQRVWGDQLTGVYQVWPPDADGSRLAAYSWRGMTSGSGRRALYLILAPFMLVNAAHWMLIPTAADANPIRRLAGNVARRVLRLFGLSLSLVLVVATASWATDVLVWQCVGSAACAQDTPLLQPLHDLLDTPGELVAFGALFPLVAVLIVASFGRATWRRGRTHVDGPGDTAGLDDPSFWSGSAAEARLRTVHVTACTAALACLVVARPADKLDGAAGTIAKIIWGVGVGLAIAMALAALTDRAVGRRPVPAGMRTALNAARWLSVFALIAGFALILSPIDITRVEPSHLPGLRWMVIGLVSLQLGLLLLLGIALILQRTRRRFPAGFELAANGFAPLVFAALAWMVAGGFSAGLTLQVAGLFGEVVLTTEEAVREISGERAVLGSPASPAVEVINAIQEPTPLIVSPALAWAGLAALAVTAVAVVVGGIAYLSWRRRRASLRRAAKDEFPGGDPGEAERVASARATASLTDLADRWLAAFVGLSMVIIVIGLALYTRRDELVDIEESVFIGVGVALIGLTALALVVLGYLAYRNERLRRTVGILWDIGTVWPRVAHPLAPPSYGERAVPDLVDRVGALTRGEEGAAGQVVVLSAHSQGTILSAAAVLQLPADVRRSVALLTYGSPLRRLYARFFPATFTPDVLREMADQVGGRWTNLWRQTDWIGGTAVPPGANPGAVDVELADPRELGGTIQGHGLYWTDPAFADDVADLVARTAAARSDQP